MKNYEYEGKNKYINFSFKETMNINAINNDNDIINNHYNDIINNLENDNFVNQRFNEFQNGNLNNENFYDDIAQHIRNQVLNRFNVDNNNLYNILHNYFNNRMNNAGYINNILNNNINDVNYINNIVPLPINDNYLQIDDDVIDALIDDEGPDVDDGVAAPAPVHEDVIVQDRTENIEVPHCRICMENRSIICFVPCGHVCACSSCSQRIDECPLCRTPITRRQGLYFA